MIDKDTEQEIVLPQKDINEVEEYVKELKAEKEKKTEKKKTVELPEFLLPQFKTVEEQAKSYKELQALQTRQAQELAKYKKNEEILLQQEFSVGAGANSGPGWTKCGDNLVFLQCRRSAGGGDCQKG